MITTVTVGYGRTYSLPDCGNVKPSVTLTAEVGDGESTADVMGSLHALAQMHVENAIDDALEMEGQEPKFYTGPLYRIQKWMQRRAIVVLPVQVHGTDLPGDWRTACLGHFRLQTAASKAGHLLEQENGYRELMILDDGNLESVHRWWEKRTWFRIYGIYTEKRYGRLRFADQVLIVPSTGITLPHAPQILLLAERFDDVPPYEVELGTAVNLVDGVFEAWTVCRTQIELDEAIHAWADRETAAGVEERVEF